MNKIIRPIQSMCLDDAKNIGLVLHSQDELALKMANSFAAEYRKKGTKVHILGFNHKRKQEPNLISDENHTFITKEDFTYLYQPKSQQLKEFINTSFDILIVFYPKDHIYIRTISALSIARLKVGNEAYNHHTFDLSIESHPTDVQLTFTNATTYLKKITTAKTAL